MSDRFYVYGLFFETKHRLDACFYIGKGCGDRDQRHFMESSHGNNPYKDRKIKKLRQNDVHVYSRKIARQLSEADAYELEKQLINAIGIDHLTNLVPGGRGARSGENHQYYGVTGSEHPAYGNLMSEDVRQSISLSLRNLYENKEHPHKGKSLSDQHKKAISDGSQGLTTEQAGKIKFLSNNGWTNASIAEKFDISSKLVCDISNEHKYKNAKEIEPKKSIKSSVNKPDYSSISNAVNIGDKSFETQSEAADAYGITVLSRAREEINPAYVSDSQTQIGQNRPTRPSRSTGG